MPAPGGSSPPYVYALVADTILSVHWQTGLAVGGIFNVAIRGLKLVLGQLCVYLRIYVL